MPITNKFSEIKIKSIWINRDERQRREIEVKDLVEDIKANGLINPITVERDLTGKLPEGYTYVLRAGERRLTACTELGYSSILARIAENLTPNEAQIIELSENLKRKDLTWKEIVDAVNKIHQLNISVDPDWLQQDTARLCGLSPETISKYLRVSKEISDGNERVATASTVMEAYNVLRRSDARAAGDELEDLLGPAETTQTVPVAAGTVPATGGAQTAFEPKQIIGTVTGHLPPAVAAPAAPPEQILQRSFLDWAPVYSGESFNFIHCDFPYGVNFGSGPQARGAEPSTMYADSPDVYWALLECFCQNLDRFMSQSAHLMFWMSADSKLVWETLEYFREHAPSLSFAKFPLIWTKSDNAGIAADVRRTPRHTYELCLFGTRSARQLVGVKADFYSAPTDKLLHPSTKPEPMLRHFMSMVVDKYTRMLDPTCGSGASLRAADSLGAQRVLGLEINPEYAAPARKALAQAQSKRRFAEQMKANNHG